MAVEKLYKKVLDESSEGGVKVKECTADVRQVPLMKKIGWCTTSEEAEKVTKASLEKAAKEESKKDSDK